MAEPSSSEPTNVPGRPPVWIGYAAAAVLALLLSGAFTMPGTRAVPYDEGIELVQMDRIEKAVVTADDVVLAEKAEGKSAATEVRVVRIPCIADEPLIKALLDRAAEAPLARETLSGEEVAQLATAVPPRALAPSAAWTSPRGGVAP